MREAWGRSQLDYELSSEAGNLIEPRSRCSLEVSQVSARSASDSLCSSSSRVITTYWLYKLSSNMREAWGRSQLDYELSSEAGNLIEPRSRCSLEVSQVSARSASDSLCSSSSRVITTYWLYKLSSNMREAWGRSQLDYELSSEAGNLIEPRSRCSLEVSQVSARSASDSLCSSSSRVITTYWLYKLSSNMREAWGRSQLDYELSPSGRAPYARAYPVLVIEPLIL